MEGRIAPATLLDASTLLYTDPDGDMVTVKFSQPIFDLASSALNATLDQVFKFSAGDAHSGTDTAQQLQLIDLSKAPVINFESVAAGASLTIIAAKNGVNGDDLVDIGAIKGGPNALGSVIVDGDLGQIDCGNNSTKVGLKSLEVQTFGAKGLTTQTPVVGTGTAGETERAEKLESKIIGALGTLTVHGDMQGYLHVVHGTQFNGSQTVITAPGKISQILIGGALKGQAASESASNNTGLIDAASSIGKVRIGTGLNDGIIGGGGTNSGALLCGDKLRSIIVSGGVVGGAGTGSGRISAVATLDSVTFGGALTGGDGDNSGVVHCAGSLKSVVISSVTAGKGFASGVVSSDATLANVTISGNINGNIVGAGAHSGGIFAAGQINKIAVAGGLIGGPQTLTGFIEGQSGIKTVVIDSNIVGGTGISSGTVSSGGKLTSLTVAGLVGGTGDNSGSIFSGLDAGQNGVLQKVKVGDSLNGGAGANSGSIVAGAGLSSALIGTGAAAGSGHVTLRGGTGTFSGTIFSHGEIGSVKVVGLVVGGDGAHSGAVESTGLLRSVAMEALSGGNGDFSGSIIAHDDLDLQGEKAGNINKVVINGLVRGGQGFHAGTITADGSLGVAILDGLAGSPAATGGGLFVGTGVVGPGNAQKIFVRGVIDGTSIRIADALGSLSIGTLTDAVISARGANAQGKSSDRAIGSIVVSGGVNNSEILAGYDVAGVALNPDAQIGSVTVAGNWTASSLVAGVADIGADGFANEDDRPIVGANNPNIISRIAAIRIDGAITGTAAAGDHFGFVAEQIIAFSHAGDRVPLDKDTIDVEQFDLANVDVSLREVPPA